MNAIEESGPGPHAPGLKRKETAKRLGCGVGTIARLINSRCLQEVRLSPRESIVTLSSIERYEEKRKPKPNLKSEPPEDTETPETPEADEADEATVPPEPAPDIDANLKTAATSAVNKQVTLTDIEDDRSLQLRAEIDKILVDEYTVKMKEGNRFPPLDLFEDETSKHLFIGDGWHRFLAARKTDIRTSPQSFEAAEGKKHSCGPSGQMNLMGGLAPTKTRFTLSPSRCVNSQP